MLTREEKLAIIKDFGKDEHDSGSTAVQVALLSAKINRLQGHQKANKKDYSSQRGLLQMVSDRKGLLKYLQRQDMDQYKDVIKRLGLRK